MKTNYIICKKDNEQKFINLGYSTFCNLDDMKLGETIAFDFETTGLKARQDDVFCCQISNGIDANYLIVLYDNNYSFYDVIPYIDNKIILGHNIVFDLGFMYKYNFFPNHVKDTLLASKIIYNGDISTARHDLGTVFERELGEKLDKYEQKNIHIVKLSQPSTIKYSFNDVDRLIELEEALFKKIVEGRFLETYQLHCRYIKALAYIEQCGLPISSKLWKEKMQQDIKNTQTTRFAVEEYIYDNIPKFRDCQIDMFNTLKRIKVSITSPKQMLKVFAEFKINTKDKDDKDSINADIISKSDHPFVSLWLAFQDSLHRVTTFGEGIYSKIENERIYTTFNPMVDTARLSTRKGGINFLNFPADKETRECFEANEDKELIVCDWSGQENVIIADLSGDKAMTASVVDGADLHCAFARVLYPEIEELSDEDIIKDHKPKRNAAKSPRFAFAYGGNAYTIHVNEGTPMNRAKEIEAGFKELHSGLFKWGEEVFQEAIKKGYIESADGWKLKLPKFEIFKDLKSKVGNFSQNEWTLYKDGKKESERWKDNPEYKIKDQISYNFYISKRSNISSYFKLKSEYQRLALNNPVQSRAGHQLKLATALFFEWIVANGLLWKVKIVNSVHDELVAECEPKYSEIARSALQNCMVNGGNHYLSKLQIKAEAHIGKSWYAAK